MTIKSVLWLWGYKTLLEKEKMQVYRIFSTFPQCFPCPTRGCCLVKGWYVTDFETEAFLTSTSQLVNNFDFQLLLDINLDGYFSRSLNCFWLLLYVMAFDLLLDSGQCGSKDVSFFPSVSLDSSRLNETVCRWKIKIWWKYWKVLIKGLKCCEKKKLLIKRYFFFSHSVFKRLALQPWACLGNSLTITGKHAHVYTILVTSTNSLMPVHVSDYLQGLSFPKLLWNLISTWPWG